MKKLAVVITDGVGFRNFVLSDFLASSKAQFDEVTILSCLPASAYEGHEQGCKIIEIEAFSESFKTWFLPEAAGNFASQASYKRKLWNARQF